MWLLCFAERKSLADLLSSLLSGHLYNQLVTMCRHYKTPMLLIEFDAEGPGGFMLQAPSELGADVASHSVISKLVVLLLHFPQVRLIWSRFVSLCARSVSV